MRLLLALPLVVLAGCGSDDDPPASTSSVESTSPAPATTGGPLTTSSETIVVETVAPTLPPGVTAGATGTDEEQAVADLAARQGVDTSAITTVSVENVTWRDGAIGCPEPGVNYTQALVDGTLIILELDGSSYQYHSGGGRDVFFCAEPQPPAEE